RSQATELRPSRTRRGKSPRRSRLQIDTLERAVKRQTSFIFMSRTTIAFPLLPELKGECRSAILGDCEHKIGLRGRSDNNRSNEMCGGWNFAENRDLAMGISQKSGV